MVDERHNRRKWFLSSLTVLCVMTASSPGRAWSLFPPSIDRLGGGLYMATGRDASATAQAAVRHCIKQQRRYDVVNIQLIPRGIWRFYGGASRVINDTVITFRCVK